MKTKIFVGMVLILFGAMLGRVGNTPEPVLRDIVQHQEYLNTRIEADPWIAPELLEVDGIIGPATIKAWERACTMDYGVEK